MADTSDTSGDGGDGGDGFDEVRGQLWGPLGPRDSELRVRTPEGDIDEALHRAAVDASFGFALRRLSAAARDRYVRQLPPRNRLIVEQWSEGTPRVLGGLMHFDMDLSLPGGGRVPVAGLTAVGVDPSAHGRGAFRALMAAHLAQARERGQAASVLMASEVPLYGRFGYGCATQTANWEIDAGQARLLPQAPSSGQVHVEHGRGAALHSMLNDIWTASGSRRAGSTGRDGAWWDVVMGEERTWSGGGSPLVGVHTADGVPDGYVLYTIDIEHGRQGVAESEIAIRELVAVDAAAELDLWRFVVSLPWARSVRWNSAPIDPAALFWLRNPRHLRRMAHFDFLWVRPLDMAALVRQRTFGRDGAVRLDVVDPVFDDRSGRFDLVVRDGVGRWQEGRGPAEASVGIADLGAAWLGGSSLAERRAVGLLGGDPGPLRMLDDMLRTDQPPRAMARF